jgi:uncharacterized protein (DUF58 family)
MKLTPLGLRVAFAATSLAIVSAILSNLAVLILACTLMTYLLIEGVGFRRVVSGGKTSLAIEGERTATCPVGTEVEADITIMNKSNLNFRVVDLDFEANDHCVNQMMLTRTPLSVGTGGCKLRTQFECKIAGRFVMPPMKVNLTSRANLFRHSMSLPNKTIVVARPRVVQLGVAPIDSSLLDDLTSDHAHTGAGTDFAGIEQSSSIEDLRRIDWKATARLGKLMIKEFYVDRQPPIMFVIDHSQTITSARTGVPIFGRLLATFPTLLESIRTSTPIGLVLYDEKSIIANIPAAVGNYQKRNIISRLLNYAERENVSPPHLHVGGEQVTLEDRSLASLVERARPRKTFDPFLDRLNRFFKDRQLRDRQKIQAQGGFLALEQITKLPDSFLVIAITDGKANLNGLVEGGIIARLRSHRVIILLLTEHGRIPTAYLVAGPEKTGLTMRECLPEEVPTVVRNEIARMSHERVISQYSKPI